MAAATAAAIIAGVGAAVSFYGAQEEARAAQRAARLNAQSAERNAMLAREKAAEDEKMFRLSFRREQESNIAQIAASGVKLEGSPMEVLRDNAAQAEGDALRIRKYGEIERESYLRQAHAFRVGGKNAQTAGQIGGAAALIGGAKNYYEMS